MNFIKQIGGIRCAKFIILINIVGRGLSRIRWGNESVKLIQLPPEVAVGQSRANVEANEKCMKMSKSHIDLLSHLTLSLSLFN